MRIRNIRNSLIAFMRRGIYRIGYIIIIFSQTKST